MSTTTTQIVNRLNTYDGDNIWQDIIWKLDSYDPDATEAADPNCASDVVILKDGSVIGYHPTTGWSAV